jgi:hypothetical protein
MIRFAHTFRQLKNHITVREILFSVKTTQFLIYQLKNKRRKNND